METKSNVPAIRFNGFDGEWISDALENQLNVYSFKPYISEPKQGGDFEVIQQGDRSIIGYANGSPFELFQKVVLFGDHTLSLYKPSKPFFVATDGVKILGTKNLSQDFFYTILVKNLPNSEGYKRHFSILKEVIVSFPNSPKEQTKIGNLFKQLDTLITQHQQKHDKLLNLKKALLEKIFPKQGATVPEIRFKEFSGEWEESCLGDLCEETYGGGTPRTSISNYWDGDIPWIQSSDLSECQVVNVEPRKSISESGLKNSATKLIPDESIAIVTRVGVGKTSLMQKRYATSQDFLSLSKLKIDPLYGVYSIWKMLQREKLGVQGTSIKGITKEELLSKIIEVPNSEIEQTKIGNLFKQLDTLITQHQAQIKTLNNIKQACLEKMFV